MRRSSSRRRAIEATALFGASLFVAPSCGGGSGSSGEADAGAGDAAGSDVDSGTMADAGASLDSGMPPLPPLVWAPCDVSDWPDGYTLPPVDTECTTVEVPLDDSDGPRLELRVARQPSESLSAPRAVFVIEGGPGGSSVFTSGLIADAMPDLRRRFDVIYVDQRGTGGSGYLDCRVSPRTEAEWSACAAAHAESGLEHYLSVDVVRDLETVRERLGFEEVSLFAVSYGTRIAFEYIRLHPDRVGSAVLDGVAPPPADLFSDTIAAVDRGVALLVRDCDADPDCLAVSPRLGEDLETRREALARSPRAIVVDGVAMQEGAADFAVFLEAFLKQSWWRPRVPAAIHDSVEGDDDAWNRLLSEALGQAVSDATGTSRSAVQPPGVARRLRLPRDSFGTPFGSPVVNMAMLCAEIFPNSPGLDALEALQDAQTWGDASFVEKASSCPSWPVLPVDADERQFVGSDVPILLVSGEVDINVDPRWAAQAAERLPGATNLVVPYATHLATYVPCAGQIETDFLTASGDMTRVDTSCLDRLPPPRW